VPHPAFLLGNVHNLDFNVNDILCSIAFKSSSYKQVCGGCCICSAFTNFNVHSMHNNFGFFPLGPLATSSVGVKAGRAITPNITNYISIQKFYTGVPNFISKIAPIASHINISLFGELLRGFHDTQILDLIQYGFPLDLDKPNFLPNSAVINHGSALQFPIEVQKYFDEEISFGAMLGPFPDPPFPDLHCSPLLTAPKDGNARRVIVDLSYASDQSTSVNSTVSKLTYVGTQFSLKLPTIDNICQVLNLVGKNVKIFKIDLARAFRQLYVDPFDIKFLGLNWGGAYYVDTSVPFGYRNGTHGCLRVTDAIRYILYKQGVFVLNYIDDIIGIAPSEVADVHFKITLNLLNNLGFNINHKKTVPPTTNCSCLGIYFDLALGTLNIPKSKLTGHGLL
jgi:hypothetical protein